MTPTYLPLSYRIHSATCGLRWDDFAGEIETDRQEDI
jgi:hypothetical protein